MTLKCICIHNIKHPLHKREFEITVPEHCNWYEIERAAMKAHGQDIGVHIDFPHTATVDFTKDSMTIVSSMVRIIVWVRHIQ